MMPLSSLLPAAGTSAAPLGAAALQSASDPAISTAALLVVAAILFSLGMLGFLLRRNLLVVFMSIELMLNAANLTFLAAARDLDFDANGQVYALLVIVVAAVEAAIGLAILIAFFRLKESLDADQANTLAG